jgi:hypothetical protein
VVGFLGPWNQFCGRVTDKILGRLEGHLTVPSRVRGFDPEHLRVHQILGFAALDAFGPTELKRCAFGDRRDAAPARVRPDALIRGPLAPRG